MKNIPYMSHLLDGVDLAQEEKVSVKIYKPPSSGPTVVPDPIEDFKDPCQGCEEDCLYCLDKMATRWTLNLQEIEEVLKDYGLQPYEADNILFRMKERMKDGQ